MYIHNQCVLSHDNYKCKTKNIKEKYQHLQSNTKAHQILKSYAYVWENQINMPYSISVKLILKMTHKFKHYNIFWHHIVVHYEFLPTDQTVNMEYYLSVMRHLGEAIRNKRPELWANNSWILHYDIAPSHTALILRKFFAKNSIHIAPQPPY